MAASNTNLLNLYSVIPTPGPQRLVDDQGAAIDLVIDDNDNPVDELNPNDIFISQPVLGPPVLTNPDGSAPNLDAAVLTPYSLVTPPGVLRVG